MAYGTVAGRYTDESVLFRSRVQDACSTGDERPYMDGRSTETIEPRSYLSQAKDLICSIPEICCSIFSRSISIALFPFNWMIENRLGVAKFVGIAMVPSQLFPWLGKHFPDLIPELREFPDLQKSREIVAAACETGSTNSRRIEPLKINTDFGELNGVICFPSDWDRENEQCILYHNPNGIVLSQLLQTGHLHPLSTPGQIQSEIKCPVILYDYRGTGLNQTDGLLGYFPFSTYETVVQDGVTALGYALERFQHVYVAGSSLGGGVATASLQRHLEAKGGQDDARVKLLSHDSFTTTSRVVIPSRPRLADSLGWLVGGNLDAETPMRKLIDRGVAVKVLNHTHDPVIPEGARMSEFANTQSGNISVFESPYPDHAVLTNDMKDKLR